MRGFSLVELSIVLVIVGLLVGGILAGRSLIRASELRSVVTEIDKINTAVYAFRDRYFALPGDITNATSFWGTDPDGCPTHTNRIAKTATCNGNGDRLIEGADRYESFRAWQHLANAGLISGQYTGVEGAVTTAMDHDPGINTPALTIGRGAGVTLYFVTNTTTSGTYHFLGSNGNILAIGECVHWDCIEAIFLPEEAWNIDTKLDDGKPGMGRLVTRTACSGGGCQPNCTTATAGGGNGAEEAAQYRLDYAGGYTCGFYYRAGY